MHHQDENPPVLHPRGPLYVTIQHHSPRSHHSAAKSEQKGCHPHYCRPRLFQSGHFHSMQYNDHRRRSGHAVPAKPFPLVWHPLQSHLRQRPTFYLPFCMSPYCQAWNRMKHQYSIPPTN